MEQTGNAGHRKGSILTPGEWTPQFAARAATARAVPSAASLPSAGRRKRPLFFLVSWLCQIASLTLTSAFAFSTTTSIATFVLAHTIKTQLPPSRPAL